MLNLNSLNRKKSHVVIITNTSHVTIIFQGIMRRMYTFNTDRIMGINMQILFKTFQSLPYQSRRIKLSSQWNIVLCKLKPPLFEYCTMTSSSLVVGTLHRPPAADPPIIARYWTYLKHRNPELRSGYCLCRRQNIKVYTNDIGIHYPSKYTFSLKCYTIRLILNGKKWRNFLLSVA